MLKNEIIECGGRRWLVREAKTRDAALSAIASARCTGSIGERVTHDKRLCGGSVEVYADVVQINSDGSERKPYSESY